MMKVVVFSDVHGVKQALEQIYRFNQDADYMISLGDNELSESELRRKDIIFIRGNYPNDPGFLYDSDITIEGKRIFFTHGHKWGVRMGVKKLLKHAITNDYDIVLYGHTHIAKVDEKYGKIVMNPGSATRPRTMLPPTYLILYIEEESFQYEFRDVLTNEVIELS